MAASPINLHAALDLHRSGRLPEAEAIYRHALSIDPNHPPALHLLGVILHQYGRSAEGAELIQRAIVLQPTSSSFHNNLGEALRQLDRCDEAIASFRRAIALRPDYPEAYNNLGGEYGRLARMGESIACLRKAIALEPSDADAHWNLSVALLLSGEWNEGWTEFEWRLRRAESPGRVFPQPLWLGQSLMGKTVLLWSEQGLGDMIQFIRYVPEARRFGGRVILEAQPSLVELFKSQNIADAVYAIGDPLPAFDFHNALMSVPRIAKTTVQTVPRNVPYIRPAEDRAAYWKQRLETDGTRKIGIAWAGRPEHPNDRRRSIPAELLKPFGDVPNVTFVTVQPRPDYAAPPFGIPLLDYGRELTDFTDTAGLISQLDLLITVDTSVAHLAGAIGKPTWLLLPFSPDWRWLMHRSDTPWYPSMRLFRQKRLGDWTEVIDRVTAELKNMATNPELKK